MAATRSSPPRRSDQLPGDAFRMVVEGDDRAPCIRLAGDFDLAALGRVRILLRGLVRAAPPCVTIDLSEVELVETMTAAFLAREQARAAERGVRLALRGAVGVPRRLLDMGGARLEAG